MTSEHRVRTRPREVASAATRDDLTQALAMLAMDGRRPRCGDVDVHDLWTSEQPNDRDQAVSLCSGCPVLQLCADAGQHERFGVWGGRDRGPRTAAA